LFLLSGLSCIRNINLPFRNVAQQLVVEGFISTDVPPYTINLSYSGQFGNTYQAGMDSEFFITDARVVIEDDHGDSTTCSWIANGTYQSTDSNFVGMVGRSYTLKIYLSNGKTYVSAAEKIVAVPPIDSVTAVYDSTYITDIRPTQLIVSVNTHDPPATQNFYRWVSFGYIPRYSFGGYCCSLCEQFHPENQISVLSDQFINGREMLFPIYYSPIYWFGKHFVEIKQYSISQDGYLFWAQYLNQTNRTGSVLDPLPASLLGNIYNRADSTDLALGLFAASDVFTKKVVFVLFFLQEYYLLDIAGQYIKPDSCQVAYPNAIPDNTDPPGWENAQIIDLR
jgi:hypothetical protein